MYLQRVTTRHRILLVDDHADIRDPLSTFLRRYDFDVDTAANGAAMRQQLQTHHFDLIVLDVMLPGEGGFSLCRTLSASSSPSSGWMKRAAHMLAAWAWGWPSHAPACAPMAAMSP